MSCLHAALPPTMPLVYGGAFPPYLPEPHLHTLATPSPLPPLPPHPLISYKHLLASCHPSPWFHSSLTPSAAALSPLLFHQSHLVPLAHLLIRPSPSQLLRTLPSAALPHATIRTERTKSCVVTLIGCAINPAFIINSHASLNMPVLLRAEEAWGSLP